MPQESDKHLSKLLVQTLILGCLTACTATPKHTAIQSDASRPVPNDFTLRRTGTLTDPRASEISGLAVSGLSDDRLWMVNDSGNSAALLAFSRQGEFQASITTDSRNRDWEALSGFQLNNQSYLLVADTGDNLTEHAQYTLSIFLEPDIALDPAEPHADQTLKPISRINFVYPDGMHDCEAVAVSVADQSILLISKGRSTRSIYTLPLELNNSQGILTATRIGTLATLQQSLGDQLIGNVVGVDLSQATALDINEAGDIAYLLTYRGIYRWTRLPEKQTWGEVMSRPPQRLARHSLAQAEAMALTNENGHLFIVSEKIPSPILQLMPAEQ